MQLFTPKTPMFFKYDGKSVHWTRHTLIEEGAPILAGREHLVKPVAVQYPAPVVEHKPRKQKQAEPTPEPGEEPAAA